MGGSVFGTPQWAQAPQPPINPMGGPGMQTNQQITSGPLAPQQQPMGGANPQSALLAQALARMQQRPQGNAMGLGGNLGATAILDYLYNRNRQMPGQQQSMIPQQQPMGQSPQGPMQPSGLGALGSGAGNAIPDQGGAGMGQGAAGIPGDVWGMMQRFLGRGG